MDELATPNLMRITGLIVFALGLLLLASVMMSVAHVAANEAERSELSAYRRLVGTWFCLPVLLAGTALQMVAEFVPAVSPSVMTIVCLGAAFWMVAYLLSADLLADRMLDTRKLTEQRRMAREAAADAAANINRRATPLLPHVA